MITIGDPIRVTPPAVLPVSLAELKAQLRYYNNDEDGIMIQYIRAAVEHVEDWTGLGLITQTRSQTFSAFPVTGTILKLGARPVQEIISVDYLDESAVSQVLNTSIYRVGGINQVRHSSWLSLATSQVWPTPYSSQDAITVLYRVGFGDDHNSVPERIRHAILMHATTLFEVRSEVAYGVSVNPLPYNIEVLLRDYRPLAVA